MGRIYCIGLESHLTEILLKLKQRINCVLSSLSQMMSQSNFLSSLQTFPKDTINDEMVELLAPYLEMEDYNMDTAKRV